MTSRKNNNESYWQNERTQDRCNANQTFVKNPAVFSIKRYWHGTEQRSQ